MRHNEGDENQENCESKTPTNAELRNAPKNFETSYTSSVKQFSEIICEFEQFIDDLLKEK